MLSKCLYGFSEKFWIIYSHFTYQTQVARRREADDFYDHKTKRFQSLNCHDNLKVVRGSTKMARIAGMHEFVFHSRLRQSVWIFLV